MDPITGAALIGAGSGIVSGMMNSSAQSSANKMNEKLFMRNLSWQKGMSDSAHQRQVNDLKLAGLNPMLSVMGGGGASSPSSSAPTMQSERTGDAVSNAASSALDAMRIKKDLKLADQQIANQQELKKKTQADTQKTKAETTIIKANEPKARLMNKGGRLVEKFIEGATNSAGDARRTQKFQQSKQKWSKNKNYVEQQRKNEHGGLGIQKFLQNLFD